MKPRRLHSATILSIVTASSLEGSCSGIGSDGIGGRRQEGPERAVSVRDYWRSRHTHKKNALDISPDIVFTYVVFSC